MLLDTHALVWLLAGEPLSAVALGAIRAASRPSGGGVFVSPITAWEIGLLARSRRAGTPAFVPDPATWVARAMSGPGVREAPLTPAIAVAASWLPDRADGAPLHGDPADRIPIATALALAMPLVTRDAKILACATEGRVAALAC